MMTRVPARWCLVKVSLSELERHSIRIGITSLVGTAECYRTARIGQRVFGVQDTGVELASAL